MGNIPPQGGESPDEKSIQHKTADLRKVPGFRAPMPASLSEGWPTAMLLWVPPPQLWVLAIAAGHCGTGWPLLSDPAVFLEEECFLENRFKKQISGLSVPLYCLEHTQFVQSL